MSQPIRRNAQFRGKRASHELVESSLGSVTYKRDKLLSDDWDNAPFPDVIKERIEFLFINAGRSTPNFLNPSKGSIKIESRWHPPERRRLSRARLIEP